MGVKEQTFVAGLMEFALCIGDYKSEIHCNEKGLGSNSSFGTALSLLIIISVFALWIIYK